jgi:hypothetical protein
MVASVTAVLKRVKQATRAAGSRRVRCCLPDEIVRTVPRSPT